MDRPKNASLKPTIISIAGTLIFSAASSALLATEFADLDRMEPVPASQQIPIVDFIRPALFSGVQLNHSGTHIGAIVPGHDDSTSLLTYELATQKVDGASAPRTDRDITTFEWLNGDELTYVISANKSNSGYLFVSEAGKLATAEAVGAASPADEIGILNSLTDDRTQLLVDLKGEGLRYDHPEVINAMNHGELVTRYPELRTDHGFNNFFWSDKHGKLEYGVTQEDGILALNKLAGESWVKCPEDLEQIDLVGSGDNPGEVVVLGRRDGVGPRPLEFMDAATGKEGEVILQDKGYDFDGWLFHDPASYNIVGAVYDSAAPHVGWFTEAYRNLQKAVDKLFPNQIVRILGMDDSGKVLLIGSWSDRQPIVYSWVNLEKHASGLIKNSQPWIDPKRMQPMGMIKYTTAEGRQMDAYITLPAGATKKNPPPVVVIPASGSGIRWVWGFDPEVQYFASRGYAVLQPNHRGSAGYTWMYPKEENWDFRKMSDDVAAATRKAIDLGLVDHNRVAIMGSDFGGYLAVAGAAFEPGLYKCAISVSALYDWGNYIRQGKYRQFSDSLYSRYLYELGDPKTNSAKYDEMSPLPHAAQVHSSLLIAWGEFDEPEVIGQSKEMASAAGKNNVPVETMSFLNESYGVHRLGHRIELYQHIEAFLSKNL